MRSESGVRRVKPAQPGRVEDGGQRSGWERGKYQGVVLGAGSVRVGMAGRAQRRRGLLVLLDLRTGGARGGWVTGVRRTSPGVP